MSILFVLLVNNSIVKTIDFNFHFINVDFHLTSPNLIYKILPKSFSRFNGISYLSRFIASCFLYSYIR